MNNLAKLPAFVFISKLWETYKRRQDELTQYKMRFLEEEAYKCFYEQYLIQHIVRIGKDIDIHASYYAKKDARAKAREIVLQVMKNGRINHCYRARIQELRSLGLR